MKKKILVVCSYFLYSGVIPSYAQADSINRPPLEPEFSSSPVVLPLTRLEFILSISVLVFGLVILLLQVYLIKTRKISSEDIIKFVTITLIIISTLFLITAGYSNDQIAPAVGLLGTIAGYLLGRIQHTTTFDDDKEKKS